MCETFGARLRRRREERGVNLITIAEQTKIKPSLLEALERDDVTQWPSGIFRRAFVRAYAHAIELDPEETVREFLELYPDPAQPIGPAAPSGDEAERANAGPHARFRSFVGSAIGSLSRIRRNAPPQEPAEALPVPDVTAEMAVEVPSTLAVEARTPPAIESLHRRPAMEVFSPAAAAPATQAVEPTPAPAVEAPAVPQAVEPPPVPQTVEAPAPARAFADEPDLLSVAELCTQFGRVDNENDVLRLLERAAALLHASGLIVWVWDSAAAALKPALAHGYPAHVVAHLPAVRRTADNVTAAAFRYAQLRAIDGGGHSSAALAVPLMTPAGCAGVLAIELEHGLERTGWVRAVATIFAAMLAQLIGVSEPASVQDVTA